MKPTFRILRPLLVVAGLLAMGLPGRAAAQTDTTIVSQDTLYEVRLNDGSVLYGRVQDEGATVTVFTQGGATVQLRRDQILSITPMRGRVVQGRVWPQDPNPTRLFFAPTARAVGQGRGYLGVYEIFFPFVTYGITNSFSISGGTPIIPGIIGEVFYIAPKITVVETDKIAAAAGVLYGSDGDYGAGIVYGVGTYGDPDGAVSLGLGWGFSDNDFADQSILMLGGELRMTSRTKFISENYFAPGESGSLMSGGVRFFGERLSADLGIVTPIGGGDCGGACFFPLVNFVYSF